MKLLSIWHICLKPDLMQIAYSPIHSSASAVEKFCAKGSTFDARSTFPTSHTPQEYAESHSRVMSSLNDLHIIQFDVVVAKGMVTFCVRVCQH